MAHSLITVTPYPGTYLYLLRGFEPLRQEILKYLESRCPYVTAYLVTTESTIMRVQATNCYGGQESISITTGRDVSHIKRVIRELEDGAQYIALTNGIYYPTSFGIFSYINITRLPPGIGITFGNFTINIAYCTEIMEALKDYVAILSK